MEGSRYVMAITGRWNRFRKFNALDSHGQAYTYGVWPTYSILLLYVPR